MITSKISTNTLHPRQYDCPARTFPQIYELSYFSSVTQLCTTLCDPSERAMQALETMDHCFPLLALGLHR